MYQSRLTISGGSIRQLKSDMNVYLRHTQRVYCRALKRFVSFAKLPDAITERTKDAKRRLQCFFVAIDIVRNARTYKQKYLNNKLHIEIKGIDSSGTIIVVHLREERIQKDRILFFISCFRR